MAYTKNEWKTGDVVTAEKLNNIEDGIESKQDIIDENTDLKTKNLSVAGKVKTQLVPSEDNKYNLGSNKKAWKNLYVDKVYYHVGDTTDAEGNIIPRFSNNAVQVESYGDKATQVELRITNHAGNEETVFNALPNDYTALKFNDNEFLKGYICGITMRNPDNGKMIFNSDNSNGGINIGHDQIDIVHEDKINLIPDFKYIGNDLSIHDRHQYHRLKIGGEEYVTEEDVNSYTLTPVIFAYKQPNSDGLVPPFAITKEGKAYYQGKELATVETAVAKGDDLYRITIDYEDNNARFFATWYGPTAVSDDNMEQIFEHYCRTGDGYGYIPAGGNVYLNDKYVDIYAIAPGYDSRNNISLIEVYYIDEDGNATSDSLDVNFDAMCINCAKIASGGGSSKLYMHSIKLKGDNGCVHLQLHKKDATPITTLDALCSVLTPNVWYQASGGCTGVSWFVVSVYYEGDGTADGTIYFNTIDEGEFCEGGNDHGDLQNLVVTDDVVEIV